MQSTAPPHRARPLTQLALALLLALGALSAAPRHAAAHANYVRSDPAPNAALSTPPQRVRVWFSERPDPAQSELALYDAGGQRVPGAAATADAQDPTQLSVPLALGAGVYTVAWKTVSAVDGDEARGFFAFVVGSAAPPAAEAGAQVGPQPAGDLQVALAVSPATVGPNVLRVQVHDGAGQAPADVQRVTLRLHPPLSDLGQSEVIAPPDGDGYAIPTLVLGLQGSWDVEVRVRRAGKDDVSTHLTLAIASTAPPTDAPSPVAAIPAETASTTTAVVPASTPAATSASPPAASPVAPAPASTAAAASATLAPIPSPTAQPADGGLSSGRVVRAGVILLALVAAALALPRLLRRRRG